MLGFLGFIGLWIMTLCLISAGIYKHFVCLCIILTIVGLILQIEILALTALTLLFGSFFALLLTGGDGGCPEPRDTVDWRE